MTEVLRVNQTSAKLTYDVAHQVTKIQNRDAKGKTISTVHVDKDAVAFLETFFKLYPTATEKEQA